MFWPLVAVSILFGIGVGIGFVLLIVPGLILLVIWSVVAPVTVLERPGVFAAFGRSRELVRGNGWNVFGVIVLVFLAVAVLSIAAGLIASGLGSVGHALVQWAVNDALAPIPALGPRCCTSRCEASRRIPVGSWRGQAAHVRLTGLAKLRRCLIEAAR